MLHFANASVGKLWKAAPWDQPRASQQVIILKKEEGSGGLLTGDRTCDNHIWSEVTCRLVVIVYYVCMVFHVQLWKLYYYYYTEGSKNMTCLNIEMFFIFCSHNYLEPALGFMFFCLYDNVAVRLSPVKALHWAQKWDFVNWMMWMSLWLVVL